MHWQDIHNLEHYWPGQLAIMRRLRDLGTQVFASDWDKKSLWHGLDLMVVDWDNKVVNGMDDMESAFTVAVSCVLEQDVLLEVEKELLEVEKLLGSLSPLEQTANPDPSVFGSAWEDHWWLLGISADEAKNLARRAMHLSVDDLDLLNVHLDLLTVAYNNASAQTLAVGALLLYFRGDKYYDLELLTSELTSGTVTDWVSVWRFLGQSFFGRDGDVSKMMLKFLIDRKPDFSGLSATTNILWETLILFFVWRDYEFLPSDTKGLLVNRYVWASLSVGVPIEKCIKLDLAEEQFLDFYLISSGDLAEQLRNGAELFIGIEPDSITISEFINNFLKIAGDADLDGYEQANYVKNQIKENDWPTEWETLLLRLIYLYIHLRECDFIDYKGLLSEAGIQSKPFEWRQMLREELTDEKLKQVKDYLVVYNRPFTAKTEMVVEFMKVAYDQEPYLSRILALSEVFEDVYGSELSPLIYFSEEDNKWQLDHSRPPQPTQIENQEN